jgi:hypothetical protein
VLSVLASKIQTWSHMASASRASSPDWLRAQRVLFQHASRYFILTAAHLFDGNIDCNKLAGPDTRGQGKPTTFGPVQLYIASREPFDFDIAAIELLDTNKIDRIRTSWTFLTISSLALPTNDPLYCLAGYPTALQVQRGNTTRGPMLVVRALQHSGVPDTAEKPVDLVYDFFGQYDAYGEVRQLGNKVVSSPALQGVSGGSTAVLSAASVTILLTPYRTRPSTIRMATMPPTMAPTMAPPLNVAARVDPV